MLNKAAELNPQLRDFNRGEKKPDNENGDNDEKDQIRGRLDADQSRKPEYDLRKYGNHHEAAGKDEPEDSIAGSQLVLPDLVQDESEHENGAHY